MKKIFKSFLVLVVLITLCLSQFIPAGAYYSCPSNASCILAQKTPLQRAAEKYIAHTQAEATQVAISLGYLSGKNASPSLMCGPLSAAILRDAGILPADTDLSAFWLLNLETGTRTLEKYFPKDKYLWLKYDLPINKIDFSADPLKAGDWVYLYSGPKWGFSHILTVTRVDKQGRAYSVSNNQKDERGFVIEEDMLYDPTEAGVGMFYDWTNPIKRGMYGTTGLGGMLVIRSLESEPSPNLRYNGVLNNYGGQWNVLIENSKGDVIFTHLADETHHPESMIKVAIGMLFMDMLDKYPPTTEGRSEADNRLRAMLVSSDESAADTITRLLGENPKYDFRKVLDEWGAGNTSLQPRQTTANDMVELLKKLYQGTVLSPESRNKILQYMSEWTQSDNTLIGASLPSGAIMYNKRGTLFSPIVVVGDTAIVKLSTGEVYYIYICGHLNYNDKSTTYENLVAGLENFMTYFWKQQQGMGANYIIGSLF